VAGNINPNLFKDALVDEVFFAPTDALFDPVSDSGSGSNGGEVRRGYTSNETSHKEV
ncbi:hypothetical protein SUGI_0952320, partial [Cryptomeria japonica]